MVCFLLLERQGFGMEISGGTDRPFIGSDVGIFVNAVKPGGICEKDGRIESGDKIIAVSILQLSCFRKT